ncbi:MAG: exonuclease subunit SbcD [Rhodobacterales bacterium]|nr:exonuclease subunit SbcD [Rhodobacterales bacterium]
MRILHTSDWHLGVSTGPASRIEEQRWFLDWLLNQLSDRQIDVLIIAGDVFDTMHPSAEASAMYYEFLAQIGATGVRDVVVIGGNHDSPSRLDAPKALLQEVNVHVVGGLPTTDDRLDRMLVPLRRRGSEKVNAVCLSVPYVHEYRLGIRTTDLDLSATRAAFRDAFARVYKELVERALERFGDVPLIATGHLTLGGESTRDDYPQEIHQVGTLEGLPVDILDPRIRYTALGHIHRCFPADYKANAWYSGSPLAYSLTEMDVLRRVLVVDLADEVSVAQVEVPRGRDLLRMTGTADAVIAELQALTWTTRLPPLVHVRIVTQMAEPGLVRRLYEALSEHPPLTRPILVEVHQRSERVESDATPVAHRALDTLKVEDVFGLMCDAQQLKGDDRHLLEAAFATVASANTAVLDEMLAQIVMPQSLSGESP